MSKLVVLASVLAVVTAYPSDLTSRSSLNGRIVGGESTTIDKVPYQVSIESDGEQFCGGSIISDVWVLTAAHCLQGNIANVTVRVGTNKMAEGGMVHSVAGHKSHEDYALDFEVVPVNDIALIRVEEPFVFGTNVQPIEMYESGEEAVVGSMGVITGWGATKAEVVLGRTESIILQIVQVPITEKSSCFNSLPRVPNGQICAAYPDGGKDACGGDSGGPLAIDGRLAGIVSWGLGCAQPGYPGVYTEVAFYRKWVEKNSGV